MVPIEPSRMIVEYFGAIRCFARRTMDCSWYVLSSRNHLMPRRCFAISDGFARIITLSLRLNDRRGVGFRLKLDGAA